MTAKDTLEAAREAAELLPGAIERAHETQETRQRLTAVYGQSRVISSRSSDSPALRAMIETEEKQAEAAAQLESIQAAIKRGEAIINEIPSFKDRTIISEHYIYCWSISRIARCFNKSPSAIKKRISAILSRI